MAVNGVDYSLDAIDPYKRSIEAYQVGMQDVANLQAMKQKQIAAQQQQMMRQDLSNFASNPNKTYADYSNIIAKYPEIADQYTKAWNIMDAGQQQGALKTASQVYAALQSGNNQIASDILSEQAQAYENSGNAQDAKQIKNLINMVKLNPEGARTSIGMLMASTNPDKFSEIYGKLGDEQRANEMQPYDIAQKEAQTGKIIAETNDIPLAAEDRRQGVGNQRTKIEYDNQYNYDNLSQNQQQFIASLDQKEKFEANKLRATKSESSADKVKRLEAVEDYANASRTAAEGAKNAARLANLAYGNSGALLNRALRNVPGTTEYTFAKDIETLQSQVFLSQIEKMRGLGALTEAEGSALKASLASVDLNQDPSVVQKNLTTIAQQLAQVAKNANRKAQLYATKGEGYSSFIEDAAAKRGVPPAEMQKIANELGL